MQSILNQLSPDTPFFDSKGHLHESIYKDILIKAGYSISTINTYLAAYRMFKRKYVCMDDWYQADMDKRLTKHGKVFSYSRIYTYVCALFGMKIDAAYLLAVNDVGVLERLMKRLDLTGIDDLTDVMLNLGFAQRSGSTRIKAIYLRLLLYTGKIHYKYLQLEDIESFHKEVDLFFSDEQFKFYYEATTSRNYFFSGALYSLHLCLYTLKVVDVGPSRHNKSCSITQEKIVRLKNPNIVSALLRYRKNLTVKLQPASIELNMIQLLYFVEWLAQNYPDITNFNQVNRLIIEDYFSFLPTTLNGKGKPMTPDNVERRISALMRLFDTLLALDDIDVPQTKIIHYNDFPKRSKPYPRYIPEKNIELLMREIHQLKCPYQRNALIILRWTGARLSEIRRLDKFALDQFSDGTPKLYIPIGKTGTARWIPIHPEAKAAFCELIEIRKSAGNLRGIIDNKTKKETDFLFMKNNKLLSAQYLIVTPLSKCCLAAGLIKENGAPQYSSHQFRHTIGTTMINNGAALTTIMKMLGHESPTMTLVYANIFDETIRKEYEETVMEPSALAGGEYVSKLKNREMDPTEIDWIKSNFHKTFLALGHCFHHEKEPICDFADACFFCSKFVTTTQHIPLLREKYETELKLISDASNRNWEREISRHKRVADRVYEIIEELGGTVGNV